LRDQVRAYLVSSHSADGFSLIEMLIVLVMTVAMAAVVIPTTSNLFGNLRLSGDARGLSNAIALAKMRAAADFTRARLYADVTARNYRIERYQKTGAIGWIAEGGNTSLSYRVNLSVGVLNAAPPNTQAAMGQASACLDNAGGAIGNTACIVFNSRGVPITNAGNPTADDALYITDGTAVYGVTVGATGLIRLWKSGPNAAVWIKQ
jgi:Tfp pilus assembly protein FimT